VISIRQASEEDAPNIAVIHVQTWQHAYQGQIPTDYLQALSIEKRTQRWRQILSRRAPSSQTFVVEAEQVIGFCSVGPSRDDDAGSATGEIYAIYMDHRYMGKGAGSPLLAASLAYLKQEGFREVIVWVLTSNARARAFYEKHGFVPDGTTKTDERQDFTLHEVRYRMPIVADEPHAGNANRQND
jgi:L-amino acid N-acyltransferase YncA